MLEQADTGAQAFFRIMMECQGHILDTSLFTLVNNNYPTQVIKKLDWDSEE